MNPRMTELLDRYLDGALSPGEATELEAMLSASDEARATFWNRARLHSALRIVAQERRGKKLARESQPRLVPMPARVALARRPAKVVRFPAPAKRGAFRRVFALAALVMLSALGLWAWRQNQPVARVGETVAAAWDGKGWKRGEVLRRDSLKLVSGVAEIAFSNGTQLVLEGPAHLEIAGANAVRLRRGRLSATVPQAAHGFTVETPAGRVVDLGTRFGVAVADAQNVEAHVFEGRVEMSGETLAAGQALVVAPATITRKPADARLFPQPSRVIAEPLVGGGFDGGVNVATRGFPDRAGAWDGERCEVVGANAGIRPQAGGAMLRFMDSRTVSADDAAEQWQFVDLAPFKESLVNGGRAELSAWFNRVAADGDTRGFLLVLAAYRGSIAEVRRDFWPRREAMARSYEAKRVFADADPATWQRGEVSVQVPPDADWLLVNIAAERGNPPRTLSGQFADTVSLRIVVPPRAGEIAR